MGLFRKRKSQLPDLITDEELDFATGVNYNTVMEWLVGLSADDYTHVLKVADIYRKADQDVADYLKEPNEPTTFIRPPADQVTDPATAGNIADQMLDIEPKPKKKVPVK